MIRIKPGVQFSIMRSEIIKHLPEIESIFHSYGSPLMITCGTEAHGPNDPHTNGYAIDINTHVLPSISRKEATERLQTMLGTDYFVLFEDPNTPNEHCHIQVRKDLWPQRMSEDLL